MSDRGGYREDSGRKPKYLSDSETTQIRVPKRHKDDARRAIELLDTLWASDKPVDVNSLLMALVIQGRND